MLYIVDDFFAEECGRGAERNTDALLSYLNVEYEKVHCSDIDDVSKDDLYLIGNFVWLDNKVRFQLQQYGNYVIFEKDFKILRFRNPRFDDVRYPYYAKNDLVNIDFYNNAKKVICLTDLQAKVFRQYLKEGQVEVIHCSFFSEKDLLLIEHNTKNEKRDCAFVSPAKHKGGNVNLQFCSEQLWDYECFWDIGHDEFIQKLSTCDKLVFFPIVMESCSRVVIEARMLGLDVYTHWAIGAIYEPWYKLSGQALIDEFRNNVLPNALSVFRRLLCI